MLVLEEMKKVGVLASAPSSYELERLRRTFYQLGEQPAADITTGHRAAVLRYSGGKVRVHAVYTGAEATYGGIEYHSVTVLTDDRNNYLLVYAPVATSNRPFMTLLVNNPTNNREYRDYNWVDLAIRSYATMCCNC